MTDPLLLLAIPFLASMIVLGLPHGAVDHHVFAWLTQRPLTPPSLTAFILIYLGLAGAFLLLWTAAPLACALGFLGLTAFHWGDGDMAYERLRAPAAPPFAIWRGTAPMALPFVLHPDAYIQVLNAAVASTPGPATAPIRPATTPDWLPPLTLAGCLLLLAASHLVSMRPETRRRRLAEDALLTSTLLLLPPILSIGLYFIFWHSLRHIRLLARTLDAPIRNPDGSVRWTAFLRMAAPFTAGALVLLGLIVPTRMTSPHAWESLVGTYLILLWSLTWPHTILCRAVFSKLRRNASDSVQPGVPFSVT